MNKPGFASLFAAALLATACQPGRHDEKSNGSDAEHRGPMKGEDGAGAKGLKRVSAVIDFSSAATIAKQVEDLGSGLDGASLVALDLTIIPSGEEQPDYRVSETPAGGEARPLACDSGQRLDSRAFSFTFSPDYNHLLLEILHGPPSEVPYSTAACAMRGGSPVPAFTIKGYYAVSAVSIPTASDVQLRPVSPGFHD